MKIYVINGPNLNLLGKREPEIYGPATLDDIIRELNNECGKFKAEKVDLVTFQSNHEGEIIDMLHAASSDGEARGIILNAGAYSHYSYAIRDAVKSMELPVIEVHISNIYSRDEFRHVSVLSAVCAGVICGFGKNGYIFALRHLLSESENI